MISALCSELKSLIAQNRVEEIFRRLDEDILDHEAELYNEVILLQNRWSQAQTEGKLELLRLEDKNISFNSINQALLWVIDRLESTSLNTNLRRKLDNHTTIPLEQAYTCNRFEQYESFLLAQYDRAEDIEVLHDGKVQFYYLYGDMRQDLPSLFERLRLEVGGRLENWKKENYDPGVKTIPVDFKPTKLRNLRVARIDFRKKLLAHFLEPINQQKPLMKRKLPDLLESPTLEGFGPEDYVFILITLDDHNWDAEISPEIVRDLYKDFCNCELPEAAPHFYFFFGIEYQKQNQQVRQEVKAAIEDSKYGLALEELTPLELKDISEWVSHYRLLLEDGQDTWQFGEAFFKGEKLLDMVDVTPRLKKIIDAYNKGISLKRE